MNWIIDPRSRAVRARRRGRAPPAAHAGSRGALGLQRVLRARDGRAAREQRVLLERLPHPRPAARSTVSYDPEPTYPLREGAVDVGYEALAEDGARDGVAVIAVDGAVDRRRGTGRRRSALGVHAARRRRRDRRHATACAAVGRGRAPDERPDARRRPLLRPDLRTSASRELLGELPDPRAGGRARRWSSGRAARSSRTTCSGALDSRRPTASHAVQRGEASNLGQPPGRPRARATAPVRRLAASRPAQAGARASRVDRLVDVTDPTAPRSLTGDSLRATLASGSPAGRSGRVRRSSPAPGVASGSDDARHRDGRDEPRLVVRADHARERDPPRRRHDDRGRVRAAPRRSMPSASSDRPWRSDSERRSRSASTTSTRWRAATSRSSAIPTSGTRARRSASTTRRTRRTT